MHKVIFLKHIYSLSNCATHLKIYCLVCLQLTNWEPCNCFVSVFATYLVIWIGYDDYGIYKITLLIFCFLVCDTDVSQQSTKTTKNISKLDWNKEKGAEKILPCDGPLTTTNKKHPALMASRVFNFSCSLKQQCRPTRSQPFLIISKLFMCAKRINSKYHFYNLWFEENGDGTNDLPHSSRKPLLPVEINLFYISRSS